MFHENIKTLGSYFNFISAMSLLEPYNFSRSVALRETYNSNL